MNTQRVVATDSSCPDLDAALDRMRDIELFGTPSDRLERDVEWSNEFADPSQVAAAIDNLEDQYRFGPRRARHRLQLQV